MSINKEGNIYTLIFATVMVVVVGGLLAYVSTTLKPIQQENVRNEKMQNILQSIGLDEIKNVSRAEAGALFNDYITERIVLDYDGNKVGYKTNKDEIVPKDLEDAFNIKVRKYYNTLSGLKKQFKIGTKEEDKAGFRTAVMENNITYPLFVCQKDGKTYYVTYCSGKGLWDDVWGYITFNEDGRTINGTVFDHKGETPGLGSKITEEKFNKDFLGKVITNSETGDYRPIKVIKPGLDRKEYEVQGLSGATFTAVGIDEMMNRSLEVYNRYFEKLRNVEEVKVKIEEISDSIQSELDSLVNLTDTALVAIK